MVKGVEISNTMNAEHLELKGFSRSIAEIEWLLLILVILYYVSPTAEIANPQGMVVGMVVFATFVLGFHYLNFFTLPTRWKLAIETWVMILFISWVLWNTGKVDSPLLNLYLLTIIASALTLGKLVTFLEFGLITVVYVYLGVPVYLENSFTLMDFSEFMTQFAPFLLIAYVTTMLASDVQYGRQIFKQLSEEDEMTGLLNKRSFQIVLLKEIKSATRHSRQLSIMSIDADNLKNVNDKYGHEAGDRLILMLANTIKECMRTSDQVSRNGGDEFAVIMPETPIEKALEAAERFRKAVENSSFDVRGKRISSTVSIGVASYPDDATDTQELMNKVDIALYKSKNNGRNQVSQYRQQAEGEKLKLLTGV